MTAIFTLLFGTPVQFRGGRHGRLQGIVVDPVGRTVMGIHAPPLRRAQRYRPDEQIMAEAAGRIDRLSGLLPQNSMTVRADVSDEALESKTGALAALTAAEEHGWEPAAAIERNVRETDLMQALAGLRKEIATVEDYLLRGRLEQLSRAQGSWTRAVASELLELIEASNSDLPEWSRPSRLSEERGLRGRKRNRPIEGGDKP